MYKAFYHLQLSPFDASPDPRFLYVMSHTREALACLEYGISARKGFIVLTGEVGTGKTTLLRCALAALSQKRVFTSFVFNPRLDILDFLEFILVDFGVMPVSRTKSGMLQQLNHWLVERYARQEACVVVVDEAQDLSLELMEEIRLLTNLETSSEKLLQIVLCGQSELEEKLRLPSLRQLRQRIALWCHTQALTPEQTAAYIAQRLLIAGTVRPIFSVEAVAAVQRCSKGIPRVINMLCEHALVLGYVDQMELIPEGTILSAAAELELDPLAFHPFVEGIEASFSHSPQQTQKESGVASSVGILANAGRARQDR